MTRRHLTNETLKTIGVQGWEDGEISVSVFTGEEGDHLEGFPVCLEFYGNEPCLTSAAARLLASALIEAADVADEAWLSHE